MTQLRDATVAIVGLGLMGGSLGLALAGRCARRIGADADAAGAAVALERGAVDAIDTPEACAAQADLVVLAVPVRTALELAPALAPHMRDGAILTDLGSTKQATCAVFDELQVTAVGGHPMCGRERSGIEPADATLFEGATWALCTTGAPPLLHELVTAVGATPLEVDAALHDRAVARISHTPYVVAQALLYALARADDDTEQAARQLAATGFQGATRLARGDVDMWRDILLTNAANVRASVADLQVALDELAESLDDPDRLEQLLRT